MAFKLLAWQWKNGQEGGGQSPFQIPLPRIWYGPRPICLEPELVDSSKGLYLWEPSLVGIHLDGVWYLYRSSGKKYLKLFIKFLTWSAVEYARLVTQHSLSWDSRGLDNELCINLDERGRVLFESGERQQENSLVSFLVEHICTYTGCWNHPKINSVHIHHQYYFLI